MPKFLEDVTQGVCPVLQVVYNKNNNICVLYSYLLLYIASTVLRCWLS